MHVFAYCAESFKESTRRAAGVHPVTCPPVTVDLFEPAWLERRGLVYFDLHGQPGRALWRGDDGAVALTAEQILRADMGGAVVFATNCWLADGYSPMMDALLQSGASYVIAGEGTNYGGQHTAMGAALLGQWIRRLLAIGFNPLIALSIAKTRIALSNRAYPDHVVADTLAFKAYHRTGSSHELRDVV